VAIGDALGSFLEGVRLDLQKEDLDILRCQPGQYTDDTSMSLCLADSLILHDLRFNGPDTRFRFYHWYFSGYNNGRNHEKDPAERYSTGIGGTTYNACMDFAKNPMPKVPNPGKDGKQNANGTIMRFAPIPIAYSHDLKKGMEVAVDQSYATHDGEEAAECCRLLTFIAGNFLNLETVEACKEFLKKFGETYRSDNYSVLCLARSCQEEEEHLKNYDPKMNKSVADRNWNWKDKDYKYSPTRTEVETRLIGIYCMDATAMALNIILYANSFKEALTRAVNLGGDADTVGAIVGTLAGALFGYEDYVKEMYLGYVAKWDEKKCAMRAYKLLKLSEKAEKALSE